MKYKASMSPRCGGFGFGIWKNAWPFLTICVGPFTIYVHRKAETVEELKAEMARRLQAKRQNRKSWFDET